MVKVRNLKSIHMILFVIVAFLLYHLIGGCGCSSDGFSVGGQSEKECKDNLNDLQTKCCQNDKNCPNDYPLICNKKCKAHLNEILTSCSKVSTIEQIKQDVCISCNTPPDNCDTIGNISISKKLSLDTSMCKTCRDRRKKVTPPPDDPCINKDDIKMSGYDVKKYDKIVTDTEFRKKECCCTDKTNCDPTTLARYNEMTCNQYKRLNLDNDVCNTGSYDGSDDEDDGYDYTVEGSKTIDEYLDGECCKTK